MLGSSAGLRSASLMSGDFVPLLINLPTISIPLILLNPPQPRLPPIAPGPHIPPHPAPAPSTGVLQVCTGF